MAAILLILGGISLVGYPWISDWCYRVHTQSSVAVYAAEAKEQSDVKAQLMQDAIAYNTWLSEAHITLSDPFSGAQIVEKPELPYTSQLALDDSGILAFIEIPKIHVYLPVYHTTSAEVLQWGAGHMEGTALPVGGVRFHTQQRILQLTGGLVGRHGQDVDGQHQIAVKVAEFRHKAVLDVAGVVLQIQHPAIPRIDLKMVGGKFHAVGAEPILEMLPALGVFVDSELRRSLFPSLEKVAENVQALGQRQFGCHRGKLRKVRHQIRADTGKVAAGLVRIAFYHAYGQITLPHNAVAGAGDL